jgi:hypothetical protein
MVLSVTIFFLKGNPVTLPAPFNFCIDNIIIAVTLVQYTSLGPNIGGSTVYTVPTVV